MKHLQELLEKTLQKRGIYTEAKASYVIEKTHQIFLSHFGEEYSPYVSIQKFTEKTVFIKCKSSSWRHIISQHKKSFLLILQAEFSPEEIEKINIK